MEDLQIVALIVVVVGLVRALTGSRLPSEAVPLVAVVTGVALVYLTVIVGDINTKYIERGVELGFMSVGGYASFKAVMTKKENQ